MAADSVTATHSSTSTILRITLLGDFVVSLNDAVLPRDRWRQTRAKQLLQLLALTPSHRLRRDEVIHWLWPELEQDAGTANLRKAAHLLRLTLGFADAVVLSGGEVRLAPQVQIDVDVHRFERTARAALESRDAQRCLEAADGYTGAVLHDAVDAPWADAVRARTREQFLALLREARAWQRLAAEDPTDEATHRELMQRDLRAGNRASALRWYARLESALRTTLGLSPDAETMTLRDACVDQSRSTVPLVGRHRELAVLDRWLAQTPTERSGGLVMIGHAGIGKTTLGSQMAVAAHQRMQHVVPVTAHEAAAPYAVATAAVERVLLDRRDVLDRIGESARTTLAQLTPLAEPATAPQGPLGRHQVFGAIRRLLLAASSGSPVILHVDDAHLVGPADADLLLDLVVTGRPAFVVLAMRPLPDESMLARRIARLEQGRHATLLRLPALSDDDTRALVHGLGRPVDDARTARIVARAQGNPFVALELAQAGPAADAGALPDATREAVLGRLCDVVGAERRLLERLAVADSALDAARVVALGDSDDAQTFSQLDTLLAAGVIVADGRRYRFRHDLVREALLDGLAPHQRIETHRIVAEALARVDAEPSVVAAHWLEAGRPAEARPALLAAARAALRVGAFAEAVTHADLVLRTAPSDAQALRLRAEGLDGQGDRAAVPAYHAAASVAPPHEADDLRAKGALAQVKLGDPAGALDVLKDLAPTGVEGRLAEALAYCGAAAMGVSPPARGTVRAAAARRLALDTGDTASIVIASWAQAAVAHARGELPGSLWADLYDTRHVPHLAVRVFDGQLCITQRLLYGSRPYADVVAFASALAAESERIGAARGHAFGVTLRGEAHLLSGALDAAERDLRQGARLHRAIGGATGESFSLQRLAELALLRGQMSQARDLLAEALDVARQTDIGFHLLDRIYGTRIALCAEPDEVLDALVAAEEQVRGPLETCPGCRITLEVPAAIAAARIGDLARAEAHAATAEYLANVVMQLPAWYAAMEEVRGYLARAKGLRHVADGHFAQAATRFGAAGQPLDAARCLALRTC